jgi:hypothetical protein
MLDTFRETHIAGNGPVRPLEEPGAVPDVTLGAEHKAGCHVDYHADVVERIAVIHAIKQCDVADLRQRFTDGMVEALVRSPLMPSRDCSESGAGTWDWLVREAKARL